jgi:hypothetical protein
MKYTRSTELALDGYELVAWYDVEYARRPLLPYPALARPRRIHHQFTLDFTDFHLHRL